MSLPALFLLLGTTGPAEAGKRADALEAEVTELRAEVARLDAELEAVKAELESLRSEGLASSQAEEVAAQALFDEALALVSVGRPEEAGHLADEILTEHGGTRVAASALKLRSELEVVGRELPEDWRSHIERSWNGELPELSEGPVLLLFFEVWCPHCKRAAPRLTRLEQDYAEHGLRVVGLTRVTKSATVESLEDYLARGEVPYPVAKEDGELAELFGVEGLPAMALLVDGVVVWRGHPARLYDEMLRLLLGS